MARGLTCELKGLRGTMRATIEDEDGGDLEIDLEQKSIPGANFFDTGTTGFRRRGWETLHRRPPWSRCSAQPAGAGEPRALVTMAATDTGGTRSSRWEEPVDDAPNRRLGVTDWHVPHTNLAAFVDYPGDVDWWASSWKTAGISSS